MIEVVSAVVIRDGRVLLTQRPPSKDFPLQWESPGGKVASIGESHHAALARELLEEVGARVRFSSSGPCIASQPIWVGRIERATDAVLVHLYMVEIVDEPRALEGQGIGWFTESEMRGLVLTPANDRAFSQVAARMRSLSTGDLLTRVAQ